MRNKKAWIRIAEAFIAITLIFSVFITLYSKQATKTDISDEVYSLQEALLKQIANDEGLRQNVLNNDNASIIKFSEDKIPKSFNYTIKICNLNEICSMDNYKKEVFASETVISSTLTTYNPKVVKIFMWRK